MKKLILLALAYAFYKGFFTFCKSNTFLLNTFSDKDLHFSVFLVYPLLFYIFLPKKHILIFLNILFFGIMTYGVEVLQSRYFHRQYSLGDLKYSFYGFFCSACLIFYFSYVSPYFLRVHCRS